MIETTIQRAGANLARCVARCASHDEQIHLFERAADIVQPLNGVPQPHNAEPVAIIISARRYAWLNAQSAKAAALVD